MANKLKNLKVTSVDLVPLGANPDAIIKIFKQRKEDEKMVNENNNTVETITKTMEKSLQSIKADTTLSEEQKLKLVHKSLSECIEFIEKSGADDKDTATEPPTENKQETTEPNTKKSKDANAMNNEKNETVDSPQSNKADEPVTKLADINPEVKKAFAEIAQLKKELEMRDLENIAKQYEILGKKPEELAPKLYELKKAGGSIYNDYISMLNEMKSAYQTSGIFKEFGSNSQGDNSISGKLNAAISEIKKASPDISTAEAIVKACDNNPELKAMYEAM